MKYLFLSDLIHQRAKQFENRAALQVRNKNSQQWETVSWRKFSENIMATAHALAHWGIREKSVIGVYTQNMAECFYIDFGAFANRAITAPMYATSSASQVKYIIDEAEIELLFVGEQFQYNNAYQLLNKSKTLKQIIIIDPEVKRAEDDNSSIYFKDFINNQTTSESVCRLVEKRMQEVNETDTVHLVYTSGTTGEPKGVILKNSNYLHVLKIHDRRLNYLPEHFTSMCMLPLTHIFEKAWSIYCLHKGCTVAINQDPREILTTIKEIKPNAMSCVPRFWEKVYAGVQEKIENSGSIMKRIFIDAVKTGKKHNLDYRNKGIKAPLILRTKFNFYNKTVYKLLKKTIGIDRGIIFPCAGAALSDTINTFIQSVNIPLIYGYGLTETTATVTCFPSIGFEIGTVGKVMPEIEVKIGDDNEILVKGQTIMHGYYKKDKATAEAFTEDGWFRTGDAGQLTDSNCIILTERIKDLYKTSNGKYIAPQKIETRLAEDRYIETAAVIGDQKKYVTALIIPAMDEIKQYADKHGLAYQTIQDLCNNQQVISFYEDRIKKLQNIFASFEQIKKFTLIPHLFSIDSGELTNTLKLRRSFINEKYKVIIEKMYS